MADKERLRIRIGFSKIHDMLKFKNLPSRRDKVINAAEDKDIKVDFPINENARLLHPAVQEMVIEQVMDHCDGWARTLVLRRADGKPAAWFKAGQYVSLKLRIGNSCVTRPYSICSSPVLTKEGRLAITVEKVPGGFVSGYLHSLEVGQKMTISGPQGHSVYNRLRDKPDVVAVAGGSGITPYMSMACAIRDGIEDFNLTIIYGSRTESQILFKEELDAVCRATSKVKVVHVLSDEVREGYEHGFITADLIRKHAPKEYSLFICGSVGLYRYMETQVPLLGLPRRLVRREILGSSSAVCSNADYPKEALGKTFNVHVIQGPETFDIKAVYDESLLVAFERAGLKAPSRCRSGECGWCRCKILSGKAYVPAENDQRRHCDKETDHVHACSAFPVSDICVELPEGDF